MEEFIKTFGDVTIGTVVVFVVAVLFAWRIYKKWKKTLIEQHEREKEKNEKLGKCLEQIEQYPKWRQQSIDIQKKFTDAIQGLQNRLEKMEQENKRRERNKLRERILQSYRYYTSEQKNPLHAWSEMEADAFWNVFGDYEDAGGNGHVHSEVQPAMRSLEVIPMHETEKISELMHSRR